MGDAFPAATEHGPLEEPFEELFIVRGTVRSAPLVTVTRNMVVLRSAGELTIVNSVRLSPEGERELERLGSVRHLVKLGNFHGMDDPYYVKKYSPVVWASKDAVHRPGVTTDRELVEGAVAPVPRASIFVFDRATKPEACLVLHRDGGILVCCDSLQNWGDFEGCSLAGKLVMKAAGFGGEARVGPAWRRFAGGACRSDFERLLALPFKHLIPGHGHPLKDVAKEAIAARVAEAYPSPSTTDRGTRS
jgi:hypothetical protein